MSKLKLYPHQQDAVEYIKKYKYVTLTFEGGLGKTLIALESFDTPPTVICQNKEIKELWLEYEQEAYVYTYHEFVNSDDIIISENFVVDEFHKISSPSSKRYKTIKKKLSQYTFNSVLLLSATPIKNDEVDVWNAMALFGKSFELVKQFPFRLRFQKEFYLWRKEYIFYMNRYEDKPYLFNEDHRNRFNNLCNILNYQHKNFRIHDHTEYFTKKHMHDYNECKNEAYYADETFSATTKLINMMQLANSTNTLSDELSVDDDYKVKIDYIKNVECKSNKIVIAYAFNKEKELLLNNLDNITDDIDIFKTDPNIRYYVRQISRSEGVNIAESDTIVFFSINYSGVSFQQYKWRISRLNSEYTDLNYHYLIFKNTIEKDIYNIVNGKVTKNKVLKGIS